MEANRLQRDTYTFNSQVLQPFTIPRYRDADTCLQLSGTSQNVADGLAWSGYLGVADGAGQDASAA